MKHKVLAAAIALGLGALVAAPASAALGLNLSDGSASVTVWDGGVGDINPAAGVVTFSGSVGADWIVNVTTGLGSGVLGAGHMDLNSVNLSSILAGTSTLTMMLTETGLTDNGVVTVHGAIGGTTDGSVAYGAFGDSWGDPFYDDETIGSGSHTAPPIGFTGSFSGSLDTDGGVEGYSMTIWTAITHGEGIHNSSFNFDVQVPEPSALALLGLGALGLGFGRRRRAA